MNKTRRKSLKEVMTQIENMQSILCDLLGTLDSLCGEEEEYRDNMPENMYGSEKYEKADAAADAITAAYDALESADNSLTEAVENIEEAMQ